MKTISLRTLVREPLKFLTTDARQAQLAKAEGLKVVSVG